MHHAISTLISALTYRSNTQLVGVFFDITGAFYLSRAFIFKKSSDIISDAFGSSSPRLLGSFGASGNTAFSAYIQGIEARIGFLLLLIGFLLQATGLLFPNIQIPFYLAFILWLVGCVLAELSRRYFANPKKVKQTLGLR